MVFRSALLLFCFLGFAVGSHAQDLSAYYPLNQGDIRVYTITSKDPSGNFGIFRGELTLSVGADTTIEGLRYSQVHADRRDARGASLPSSDCQTRFDPVAGRVEWRGGGDCARWGDGADLRTAEFNTGPVPIGPDTVNTTRATHSSTTTNNYIKMAYDIGIYNIYYYDNTFIELELSYSLVNGIEYGTLDQLQIWMEYDPRNIGDEWTYHYTSSDRGGNTPDSYIVIAITGDTLVDGTAYKTLARSTYALDGTLSDRTRTPIRADLYQACYITPTGDCYRSVPNFRLPRRRSTANVSIGGTTYQSVSVWSDSYTSYYGSYGSARAAYGVGLLYSRHSSRSEQSQFNLRHAWVAGVEYGVRPSPIAVSDTVSTPIATPIDIAVLANDFDPTGQDLTVTAVSTPTAGTATTDGQTIRYTPAIGRVGTHRFDYTVTNTLGASSTATVTISVLWPSGSVPTALADSATTSLGTPMDIAVLANDFDPTGQGLTVTAVSTPTAGTATTNGQTIVYTPAPTGAGAHTFTYTATNAFGASSTATVTVAVLWPPGSVPTAIADSASTSMGRPVNIAVLANDLDPIGEGLTVGAFSTPTSGSVTMDEQTVLYTPQTTGVHTFTYTAINAGGPSNTATVTVIVAPANSPFAARLAGPSPASRTRLAVTGAEAFHIDVFDALGRPILSRNYAGVSEVDVDLSRWSAGVYFMRVTAQDGEETVLRVVRP